MNNKIFFRLILGHASEEEEEEEKKKKRKMGGTPGKGDVKDEEEE